mgnify:CR=1 FL=1
MKRKRNIKSIVLLAALGIATLFFINISFASTNAKVNVETANLRESADENSKILEQLSQGQEVEIVEKSSDWYKVKVKGMTGYLRQDLLTVEEKDTVNANTTTSSEEKAEVETTKNEETKTTDTDTEEKSKIIVEDTKLKIVPSINATDIIEVKKDEEVIITETINDWVCVQTKTTKGWIYKEKLKSKEDKKEEKQTTEQNQVVEESKLKTLYIGSESVNLRKEANTNSEVVTKLSLNTAVDVYAEENGWSKVKVNGNEGYISSSLLSEKKKETSRSLETPRTKTSENSSENTKTSQEKETTTTVPVSGKGATAVETAKKYIGCSYVYGASGPSSFDCSGFTSYVFKQHGISLNRTAAGQYSNGVAVSRNQLQPGDLVMFGKSGINHVGIYIGGGQIVHAANKSRGVTTDTINSGYYNNNYVGARRVM